MKKNRLLTVISALVVISIVIFSCSTDDNGSGGGDSLSSITLKANNENTVLGVNEQLTFNVTGNNNADYTASSIITVNGTAISGNTYTFEEGGDYTFQATYEGLISNELTYQVFTERYVTVSKERNMKNEPITFSLLEVDGTDVTGEGTFYVNGSQISGNNFSTDIEGTYEIYATYSEFQTDALTFEVYIPKRKVSYEDYTGAWCGWCPRVTTSIHQLRELTDDIVVVAIHNGDAMVFPQEAQLRSQFNVSGFPTAKVNRVINMPYPEDGQNAMNYVMSMAGQETNLSIAIDTQLNGDDLSVTARVISEEALSSDYKIVVYVTQNGLIFPQRNYYNTVSSSPWFGMGDPITNFVHDDILEVSLTNIFGDPLAETPAFEEYTVSFPSVNLSAFAVTSGSNTYDPARFDVAVYIVNQNNMTQNAQHVKAGQSVNFE